MSEVLGRSGMLRGTMLIAIAMGVMNLSTYGFTIIAARLLGPSEYGALAAVMGLLLVVNVVSLGLQATGARRVSSSPEDMEVIEADILTATFKSAIAVGLICLVSVPVVSSVLRLDSWLTAGMIALTAVPLTIMGGQAGILQGERRWLPLALIYLAMGVGRLVFGTVAILLENDTLGAMTGVAVGAVVPVLVGSAALRQRARAAAGSTGGTALHAATGHSRRVVRELFHNSHALLAFFALSNVDVVIARVVLDDHQGGLYAGGLILAKAVLFLPQFVVVVAFPSMSAADARASMTLKALAMVLTIGLVATGLAWAFEDLAVQFIGGDAYGELGPVIWAFAAVGTIWAMIQLLVYNVVARQNKRAVGIVWAGLVVLVALAPLVMSVDFLLSAVIVVEGVVLLVLLALGLRRTPAPSEGARTGAAPA
ncbi:MAG TPA: oligosaccharide flippase family protein [Nocardioidaceae bacterium]|nr:oligosaccharide flippase family protein [Nocardioidaceae bacterium]